MSPYKMMYYMKYSILLLGLFVFFFIQNAESTTNIKWNKECYNKNDCYKLLEIGKNFTWHEAYELCQKEKGYLLNHTWFRLTGKIERFNILQKLLNDSDTWTSLQLVNGYIQEKTTYTSYAQSADELWELQPIWTKNTCVKLTTRKELKTVKCTTKLPVICISDLEKLDEQVSDCSVHLKPDLTVIVSGTLIDIQDDHVELKLEDREKVILRCDGLENKSRIDWIKDGVYLNRRINAIQPVITTDPSKIVNNYSIQGTYWCEAWSPGCLHKFSSNKVNLTFEDIVTVHLSLKQKNYDLLSDDEVAMKVNKIFKLCGTKTSIAFDVRRGYTNVENNMLATYNFYTYIENYNMSCNAEQYIFDAGKLLSAAGMINYYISYLPTCLKKSSVWQKSAKEKCNNTSIECTACPKDYVFLKSYCIHVTRPKIWMEAYQDCFLTGIEKTPFDVKSFWMDSDLLDNLVCMLKEKYINYIWLAAERKLDGGPIYYSGPVKSDFSYSFNDTENYDIGWEINYSGMENRCVALNIQEKKLVMQSCKNRLPFVCLFPSEFWTNTITYDSFRITYENSSNNFEHKGGIPWGDAREKCRQSGGDLVQSSKFTNYIEANNSKVDIYYIGKQNSETPTSPTILQHNFTRWTGSKVQKVYQTFNKIFLFENTNDSLKTYVCVLGQNIVTPRIDIIKETEENYIINMYDIHGANYIYGIKCYLNGKCIKSDKLLAINVTQQGYLFCEMITHMPVMLLKSNVILVQNSKLFSFASQIFDPHEIYNFKLHDLSVHGESEGSIFYYRQLLNKMFNGFSVTIQNISASSNTSGIYVDFHIEAPSSKYKLQEIYTNISVILPVGKEIELGKRQVYVSYVRNAIFCMEERMKLKPNSTNCTNEAIWPTTAVNKDTTTLQKCVTCESKMLKRSCVGNFNTGAKWGPVKKFLLSPFQISKEQFVICEDIFHATEELINNTVKIIEQNKSEIYNTTSTFVGNFQNLLIGKNVNGSFRTGAATVSIYSTTLENNIHGYIFKNKGNEVVMKPAESDETEYNVTVAIFFTPNITAENENNASILISLFNNTILFPNKTDNAKVVSPVVFFKSTDNSSITFPIRVHFTSEQNIKLNTKPMCATWSDKTNTWDGEDALYNGTTNKGLHKCLYYRFSSFALLLRVDDGEHLVILDTISKIGCYLSLIGLALILLTFILFHRWRTHIDSKIVASLSFSLFVMYLIFIVGFTQTSKKFLCIATGATLHYFILASFCWMFVEAYHNYLKFVKVIGTYIPRFIWKASVGAWGVPLIPVVALLCYNYELYMDEHYCWVHGEAFYFALVTPLCILYVSNLIIFLLIIIHTTSARQRFKSNQEQYSLLISQLKMCFCVFMLLGLSWIFGFLALAGAGVIFSYLFCFTSTMQGFIIFIFFILQGKRAKRVWQDIFLQCYDSRNLATQNSSSGKTKTSNMDSSVQTAF